MKLSVPFNGQEDLIPQLDKFKEVVEVYGKLTTDFIGGGKHSFQTPLITKNKLRCAVKEAHALGLEFNYLLNSSCLDNTEWTISGQKNISKVIDWVVSLNIDAVTVAVPYLLEMIKKRYNTLKVYVSDLAYVNTACKAKFWEDLGADRITLFNVDLNRNFPLLEHIRDRVSCQLKLILNANCLLECPFYMYHANTASHASQSGHNLKGFVIDYCRIRCRYQQIIEPVNFIRSTWIRPEDMRYYEDLGIDYFKIIDRGMTTKTILSIIEAYTKREYSGNLLDLFPDPSKSITFVKAHLFHKIKYFFRPFTVNIFKLSKFSGLLNNSVYIDNKKLDGFIEGIRDKECSRLLCKDCGYCQDKAKESIRIDEELNNKIKGRYEDCLKDLVSGGLFSYSNTLKPQKDTGL